MPVQLPHFVRDAAANVPHYVDGAAGASRRGDGDLRLGATAAVGGAGLSVRNGNLSVVAVSVFVARNALRRHGGFTALRVLASSLELAD